MGAFTLSLISLGQQDYTLLMGAITFVLLLAVVMYVTRKVDRPRATWAKE